MKRDWEIIRQVLIAVEEDKFNEYLENPEQKADVVQHTLLLIEAGFLTGSYEYIFVDDRDKTFNITGLTWNGYELLDTIRSRPVWEKIKLTAIDKGLELTFDVVKTLSVKAVQLILGE
ncbi:DUF2513 domain-containing protein [Acinetobacter sp. ANC 5033]|jgi:hypothetical protein|uniref:DUF2513 domain-containing protein n=1 Tax=Acinetobacter amyesii TaxID=2942470 RepID=UPI00201B7C7A|nr:DUF2513 domain-containing protein [Acinetobacter amyesii]MCL6237384.1 DUF2513 domain-containing protein [Acinetobacter amyesii]